MAVILFAALTTAMVGAWVFIDHETVIRSAQERTRSVARMIAAHGEEAINDANLISSSVESDVATWDLKPGLEARRLFNRLRDLSAKSAVVSSAWILDGEGVSRLDTWTYPARPIDGKDRSYYQRHAAGASDPVIAGDTHPGAVTGVERFTFSKALRNADGSIHAIVVVAVLRHGFDALYAEAANWPEARAGLYVGGETLARLTRQPPASDEFLAEMHRAVQSAPAGSTLLSDRGVPRLVSWQRSTVYPSVYATSSQTMAAALTEWKVRTAVVSSVALIAVLGFALFGWKSAQASAARKESFLNELALREAHHRVKNSLNLMVSMIGLQARTSADAATRAALQGVAGRIHAIADAHELLQNGPALGRIDVLNLLRQLSSFARLAYLGELEFEGDGTLILEAKQAISIGVIANELMTNAMKHARSRVLVATRHDNGHFVLEVSDDGPGLPATFDLRDKKSFGLSAAMLLVGNLSAELSPKTSESGTTFTLTVPLQRSVGPEPVPREPRVAAISTT
jgi:two-component sensor histidine kinase